MTENVIGFPQIGSPFTDKEGRINQAWLQLLITLWKRTGGAVPSSGSGTAVSEDDIKLIDQMLQSLSSEIGQMRDDLSNVEPAGHLLGLIASIQAQVQVVASSSSYARVFLLMGA
jgi:hypothetical protein